MISCWITKSKLFSKPRYGSLPPSSSSSEPEVGIWLFQCFQSYLSPKTLEIGPAAHQKWSKPWVGRSRSLHSMIVGPSKGVELPSRTPNRQLQSGQLNPRFAIADLWFLSWEEETNRKIARAWHLKKEQKGSRRTERKNCFAPFTDYEFICGPRNTSDWDDMDQNGGAIESLHALIAFSKDLPWLWP